MEQIPTLLVCAVRLWATNTVRVTKQGMESFTCVGVCVCTHVGGNWCFNPNGLFSVVIVNSWCLKFAKTLTSTSSVYMMENYLEPLSVLWCHDTLMLVLYSSQKEIQCVWTSECLINVLSLSKYAYISILNASKFLKYHWKYTVNTPEYILKHKSANINMT